MSVSRYDFMKEGCVQDEKTGSLYPDPLSLNYLNLELTSKPIKDVMSNEKIMLFWEEARLYYGKAYLDDLVLTVNGIPHKNFLRVGDEVFFPTEEDFVRSFSKERNK